MSPAHDAERALLPLNIALFIEFKEQFYSGTKIAIGLGAHYKKGINMLKSNFYVAVLVAVATFAGLGLSSAATDDPQVLAAMVTNNEAQDAALGERVETLLRTDIGLAGSNIRVFSNAAVITVAGTVPDEHALRRALDLASGVRGVREVRNAMEVDVPK